MTTSAEILDRALEGGITHSSSPSLHGLLRAAAEVVDALGSVHLTRSDQDRIYARSLTILEEAVREQRRGWQRVLHLARPRPAVLGGAAAALTLGAAAIGWAVLHGRQSHSPAHA